MKPVQVGQNCYNWALNSTEIPCSHPCYTHISCQCGTQTDVKRNWLNAELDIRIVKNKPSLIATIFTLPFSLVPSTCFCGGNQKNVRGYDHNLTLSDLSLQIYFLLLILNLTLLYHYYGYYFILSLNPTSAHIVFCMAEQATWLSIIYVYHTTCPVCSI
jgi:hypothetical protein